MSPGGWRYRRYWKRPRDRIEFTDGTSTLERHEDIRIVRHVKVQGDKSPGACPERSEGMGIGSIGAHGWGETPPSRPACCDCCENYEAGVAGVDYA